jgi:kumamolisin
VKHVRTWRSLVVALGFLAVVVGLIPLPSGAQATDTTPVRLTGHVLRALASANRVGAVDTRQQLTLTVALRPSSPAALETTVRQASLRSLSGGAPLQPADVARAFGQSDANVDTVAQFFRARGFQIGQVQPDHLSFQVTGTVGQVERALDVDLGSYTDDVGHSFFATANEPALPNNVARYVQAIVGLDNYPAFRAPRARANGPTPGEFGPPDMQTAYNVTPLYAQGWRGAGQTIGIIECDAFNSSDIQNFRQTYNIPAASISTVAVDGGPSGSDPETTLDLEWSGAIATGAALRLYGFPSGGTGCPFQGLLDALTQAVNDNGADVLSISLGACESTYDSPIDSTGSTYLGAMENEFAAAAVEKIGVFVASGDYGAYTCTGGQNSGPPSVSYPASSPNVVAVGGTSLQVSSTSGYVSETAWGDPSECGSPCGSGGGFSQVLPEPAWQSQAGISDSSGLRGVPDVSLNADPATGYVIDFTMGSIHGCSGLCGGIGGTSIAAPQWAGLQAIANQASGHRLGNMAPTLYGRFVWGQESDGSTPFHDVTTGNNLFYGATAGWDPATGLGSLDALAVVNAIRASQCQATGSSGGAVPTPLAFRVFLPYVLNC